MEWRSGVNVKCLFSFTIMEELLELARDNNRMLKEIIGFINIYLSKANEENQRDFERNIIANLISSRITGI